MSNLTGKRIVIDSESKPELNGHTGVCLGDLPGSNPPSYRVAFDDGEFGDLPGIILQPIETDITDVLTRPPLPPVTSEDEQTTASIMAARVWQLMEYQRLDIVEIEAQIKEAQAKIAADIRATHSALYESQRVIAIVFAAHEQRVQAGAESVWHSKGEPAKGKTYGAAQIADEWTLDTWDEDEALAYARTQAPNMIETRIDATRFQKAVRDGVLKNVPEKVCKWKKGHTVKTLKVVLNKLASAQPGQSESE